MVKYSGTSVEIATMKGPVEVPVSVGGVAIKPQLLQTAGAIIQILDWLQFTACQKIQALRKLHDIPHKTVVDLILKQDEDARMVAYLAIISITACSSPERFEKVLSDWIAATLPRTRQYMSSPKYSDAIPSSAKEKTKVSQEKLERIEGEIEELDEHMKYLKAELQDTKTKKHQLAEERDELRNLLQYRLVWPGLLDAETLRVSLLEKRVSEATEVFPYLSNAISKNKPFNIQESLKVLEGK